MPTLLIADEKPHAERLKEVLEQQGFTCSTASKAGEAVKLLAQQQPDLFLLDPHLKNGRIDRLADPPKLCPKCGKADWIKPIRQKASA